MASAPAKLAPVTLEAFERLEADAPGDERWELVRGRILRAMVGARWEHNRIINNIGYELRRRFDDLASPCRIYTETFRMRDAASQSSLLPDLMIICHPLPPKAASLNDPTVVIEVLSDSTSKRDRTAKWGVYRGLPSLRHGVLVSTDYPRVEVFDRSGDDWSEPRVAEGLETDLALPAVGISVPLHRIYWDVLTF